MKTHLAVLGIFVSGTMLAAEDSGKLGGSRKIGGSKDGTGKAGTSALGAVTKKTPIQKRILQVLDAGLLFSGSGTSTFILVGHPDQKTLADGDVVNCYAIETTQTIKYTDTMGAERTARVYRWQSKRIGR